MAAAIGQLLDGVRPDEMLVVGDRASTDGALAVALGCPFALVRSGVTLPGMAVDVPVHIDAADLAAVVDVLESSEDGRR